MSEKERVRLAWITLVINDRPAMCWKLDFGGGGGSLRLDEGLRVKAGRPPDGWLLILYHQFLAVVCSRTPWNILLEKISWRMREVLDHAVAVSEAVLRCRMTVQL
jgi:hypothetical protein